MQAHIDQVTDIKQGQYGISSKLVCGVDHYFVNSDASEYVGKTVELEVSEKRSKAGKLYKIAKILSVVQDKPQSYANGAATWSEYETIACQAHELAKKLEPDGIAAIGDNGEPIVTLDRSRARIALVSTVLIAFSNGKIASEEDDGPVPF
jgi:hypothetical protein